MINTKESWSYNKNEKVWVGKYQNSHNLSHWHSDCELIYVCQGNIDIMHDKNTYSLSEGDSFFIESEKIHNMHAECENTIIIIIVFDYEIIKDIVKNYELISPLLSKDYNLSIIYNELFNELTNKNFLYEISTENIIKNLVLKILRNEEIRIKSKEKTINLNLMKLLNDIDQNYYDYTLTKASSLMNMNSSYFSRFFHNHIGIPFSKYLNCVKIEKAINLIHTSNNNITEIALSCGFQTIRNFNRTFKEYTGYCPTNIPDDYNFNGLNIHKNSTNSNPTLSSSKLIEFSSPRK